MFLEAETAFGLGLLKTLPANESVVFSPLSIALALSLVHIGARGESREQIGNVLLNGANDDQFLSHFQFISSALKEPKNGVKVNVANRVYLKNGFTVQPDYLKAALANYDAKAETLDFTAPTASEKINKFVGNVTNGMLKELVTPDAIKDAVALLINAVYFKAAWDDDFGPATPRNFTQADGRLKSMPFLSEWFGKRGYASDDVFQVLTLDYKDRAYRLAIFLPKTKQLKTSLEKLSAARLQKLLTDTKETLVNLNVPKFSVETEVKLKESLQKMGITRIFTDKADLSGMAKNVMISDGAHRARIDVNEEGTTAAAATVIKAVPMSMPMGEPVEFTADRPFFFALLRENHPLFMGTFFG